MLLPDGGLHSLLQLGFLFIMPDSWFLAFLVAFFMPPCCMHKSKQLESDRSVMSSGFYLGCLQIKRCFEDTCRKHGSLDAMNDRGTTELRAKERYLSNFRKLVSHLSHAATKDRDMPLHYDCITCLAFGQNSLLGLVASSPICVIAASTFPW